MAEKTTLVFLGTPDFACPFLDALAKDDRFEIIGVVTQEDKPVGRKKILTPPPVKSLSLQLGLPVYQPPKLNKDAELIEKLTKLAPDFLLVIAFGQILSSKVLAIPKIKPVNVHGSILPKYRGASPIEQALLNGDSETGLSIMEMALEMDAGGVYSVIKCHIEPDETNITLRQKLSQIGAQKLGDILMEIKNGKLFPLPQDPSGVTFCQKITRENGLVNPSLQSAKEIYNRWRAFQPWPGIFIKLMDKQLKLLKVEPDAQKIIPPGQFHIEENSLFLGCQTGTLQILEIQLEGKNAQDIKTFLQGNLHYFQK